MDERDAKLAVDTACADLQAQLEATERTLRHIDDDVVVIDSPLVDTLRHADAVGRLVRHTRELRENLREQRTVLNSLRREARALCEVVRSDLATATSSRDRRRVEADHHQLRADHKELRQHPHDMPAHAEHKQRLHQHLADLHQLKEGKKDPSS